MKFFKLLLEVGIAVCVRVISFFVEQDRVTCSASGGNSYSGNPKYVYEYIKKDKNLSITSRWVYRKGDYEVQSFLCLYSWGAIMHLAKSKVVVIDSYDYVLSNMVGRHRIIFQTWHGTPLKLIGNDSEQAEPKFRLYVTKFLQFAGRKPKKRILSSGGVVSSNLQSAFGVPADAILELGYPRNDHLFSQELNRLEKGLSKKVIYTPTWRSYKVNLLSHEEWAQLDRVCQKLSTIFDVKNHPKRKAFDLSGMSNVRDVSDNIKDINKVYGKYDILVTDFSSTFFDFGLLGRPIIFFAPDLDRYLSEWGFYYDYKKDVPGPIATNFKELVELLTTVDQWFHEPEFRKKYEEFFQQTYPLQDGRATERCVGQIQKWMAG